MPSQSKVKKVINYRDIVIKLYDVPSISPDEQIANIKAFDSKERLLWEVEKPTFNNYYYDMQLDEVNSQLDVEGGTGRRYIIDINTGKILRTFLVK
jgi:hypothetical protein